MSASLLRAFGALSVSATRAMVRPTALGLATRTTPAIAPKNDSFVAGGVFEQVRGMKVHSSVKKRCEHCKVR